MKEKAANRFEVKSEQGFGFGAIQVLVDTETGVNYIIVSGTNSNYITPLIGANGEIVVDAK